METKALLNKLEVPCNMPRHNVVNISENRKGRNETELIRFRRV